MAHSAIETTLVGSDDPSPRRHEPHPYPAAVDVRVGTLTRAHGRPCLQPRDPRRQPPLPRRGGGRLRRQVGDRLRRGRRRAGARQAHEAARPHARAVPALARDRRGHRLLLAQPPQCRGRRARHLHRHLARHAGGAGGERAAAGSRSRDRRLRRRRAAVRGRVVRPRARPRRAAPPAGARALVRRVRARPQARRDAVLRRRALAPGRSHRGLAQARRHARRAAVAQGGAGARPTGARATAARRARTTPSTRWSPWSTCTRSTPPTCSADAGRRARPTRGSAARSCSPTGSAGSTARSRRAPTTTTSRGCGSSTRSAATSGCRRSTARCSSRGCRRRSSTT